MINKADDDILSEIISSCEKKMVSPFKKKANIEMVLASPEEEENEIDENDLADLLEAYKCLKEEG